MKSNLKRYLICLIVVPILSWGASNNFLVISDIHLNENAAPDSMVINPSKPNTSYDIDSTTLDKLIFLLSQNIQKGIVARPDFIILLGDLVGHNSSPADAVKDETYVFNKLKTTFPQTPIFYTFGNNDSLVQDYGTFSRATSPKSAYEIAQSSASWDDGFLSIGKTCGTPPSKYPCLIDKDVNNGFYSAYIQPGFRLISLNSVLFSQQRVGVSDAPATAELKWLDLELQAASQHTESVMIIMHIPPGNNVYDNSNFWQNDDQVAFLQLINKYSSNIIGILASHTHAEELKMIKSNGKSIAGAYLTAALSTSHGNAPSVKTFYYASSGGKWQLSTTETFNFTGSNQNPIFNKLYDFKNYYCNGSTLSLLGCLDSVNPNDLPVKMKEYLSAKNPNFGGSLNFPNDIVIGK